MERRESLILSILFIAMMASALWAVGARGWYTVMLTGYFGVGIGTGYGIGKIE